MLGSHREIHGAGMEEILFLVICLLFSIFSLVQVLSLQRPKGFTNIINTVMEKKSLPLIGAIQFCHVVERSSLNSLVLSFTLLLENSGWTYNPSLAYFFLQHSVCTV